MKKFAKMSLVAALAVAGTAASAQPLAEAIKNVDVSGTVAYRYNDYEDQAGDAKNSATNNYKIGVNLSSKVNDDVTANTRFIMGSATSNVGLGTSTTGDANVDAELSEVNFTYTGVENLSVTVGKQAIATPWTIDRDAMGNEATGTGAVAVYNVGPATLVGAYFNQTNLGDVVSGEGHLDNIADTDASGSNDNEIAAVASALGAADIYVLGGMATFSGVTLDAFYADLADEFDSYTIGLSANYEVGGVKLSPFARYSELEADRNGLVASVIGTDDQELWQIGLGAKMGIFSAFAAYGEAGKDGGMVYLDSGAKTNMDYHWRVTADGSADTEYLYVHATADVTDKINVGLFYSEADYKDSAAGEDTDEIYAQVKYQMSKNLATYVRFGELDVDNAGDQEDGSMGRLHVQYSF
ncbi:hypothetical protein CRV01_12575 [Arcobacter sp. CECT 8983]|uniref:porin n=1 Tax=Arcobacter sp. CECT 8983 TaxID=2044508 RepID=UPI00100B044F|nr:porin [Arcobacter sp. CECT 8983]RXJ88572.1 hypothetical protein CRV01_12575 [Arcobacter sp. CECT 8983]